MTDLFCPQCIPRAIWALSTVAFLGALWGGSRLYRKPSTPDPPPVKQHVIKITFDPYDSKGKKLDNDKLVLIGSDGNVAGPEKSELPQVRKTLRFQYHNQFADEEVEWRPGADFRLWLESELPGKMKAFDPGRYDASEERKMLNVLNSLNNNDTGYHYPVLFRAEP